MAITDNETSPINLLVIVNLIGSISPKHNIVAGLHFDMNTVREPPCQVDIGALQILPRWADTVVTREVHVVVIDQFILQNTGDSLKTSPSSIIYVGRLESRRLISGVFHMSAELH